MRIKFARKFAKQYDKADQKIRGAVKKRIELFKSDPHHPQLRNHPLSGNYSGYRSINITGDWRAIYTEEKGRSENIVIFEMLGTHSQLYK